ncbi:MAG: ATP-binding cassette domain-containing protein [Anaerolineales bacterium]
MSDNAQPVEPLIQIHDLHYAYPNPGRDQPPSWILRGVDLSVNAGEVIAVMGPTGAGKSTLALSLLGIVPQSTGGLIRGRVRIAGLDPRTTPVAEVARRVGLVFQDPETQFLTHSVEEEIAFGLESLGIPRTEMIVRLRRALAETGLQGLEQRSPHQLSGGEKQRVAIAAILAMQPQVLVLDEATASLDPAGASAFAHVVADLRAQHKTTIVLISNDSDWVLAAADRVALLGDGRIIMEGPTPEILRQRETLRSLGLAPPQLYELAAELRLRTDVDFEFKDIKAARRALVDQLQAARQVPR